MTTHLCPVCGMPCPAGLAHCSLRCEEADGMPADATEEQIQARLLADAEAFMRDLCGPDDSAPVEGASDGDD